jgi:aspartate aminotransferase-like enzyme
MASSNKCLEGVPGLGFVIAREKSLAEAAGNASSLCLDLQDQHAPALPWRRRRGSDDYVCVPVQGSGTFAVEAALGTLVPAAGGKVLVLVNGAYGARMAKICTLLGRDMEVLENAEHEPTDVAVLAARLEADPAITHVAAVHCETTSGILIPSKISPAPWQRTAAAFWWTP